MTALDETESLSYSPLASPAVVKSSYDTASSSRAFDVKRVLDITLALIALLLCAPVMAIVYCLLSISGGALYAQRRVGKEGALFICYKFRSMVPNAAAILSEYLDRNPAARDEWQRNFKLADDPRITLFGRWLRRTSIDELPQLFNVLRGDMSLVGPRPIVPEEIARYDKKISAYYSCRPGLTGLWQVSGRNLVSYEKRVALDAIYARKRSLGLDLYILGRTVRVVLSGYGAC